MPGNSFRAVSWNINRGCRFDEILEFLRSADADLILLQECDRNALRSGGRNVAREIAQNLRMNYVFGSEFLELAQGNGNIAAHHGQATLCRLPISKPRILRFPHQSTFWKPRWFLPSLPRLQRRLGGRMVLVCKISINGASLMTYNLHLESRNRNTLRLRQLNEVLKDAQQYGPDSPLLIAGDFNFDITQNGCSKAIQDAGFQNPFASKQVGNTIAKRSIGRPRAIDWILLRGPLISTNPRVHVSVPGSDHYPLSLEFAVC